MRYRLSVKALVVALSLAGAGCSILPQVSCPAPVVLKPTSCAWRERAKGPWTFGSRDELLSFLLETPPERAEFACDLEEK